MLKRIVLLLWLIVVISAVQAQPLEVFVTVQDNAILRAGPGQIWDRLTVLPYGTTYRAVGRTLDGDWIQIAYKGELDAEARREFTVNGVTYGWVASWLLIWSGNILELPIDGIVTIETTRSAGSLIVITPDTYVYEDEVDPSRRIPSPVTSPVRVEVTGRLGSAAAGFFWVQFKMNGKYYWTASWDVGVPYRSDDLPDASYLYPYSRLQSLLQRESRRARNLLGDIGGRWRSLDQGQPVTCNNIPDNYSYRGFTEYDLRIQPLFAPAAAALTEVRDSLNAALAAFRSVCDASVREVSAETIRTSLDEIRNAERHLTIIENWVIPFQRRDPLLGGSAPTLP